MVKWDPSFYIYNATIEEFLWDKSEKRKYEKIATSKNKCSLNPVSIVEAWIGTSAFIISSLAL